MKFNRLKGMLCYLSGAMDQCPIGGRVWREEIGPLLKQFGVGVLDPTDKPTYDQFAEENGVVRGTVNKLKEEGRYTDVANIMKEICAIDLRMVDICHFVVLYLDMDVYTCGSYHEAFVAIQQKKPVLIVCKQGKVRIPNWMFGVVNPELMFNSFDEMFKYLTHINSDENVEHLKRWRFFDLERVF